MQMVELLTSALYCVVNLTQEVGATPLPEGSPPLIVAFVATETTLRLVNHCWEQLSKVPLRACVRACVCVCVCVCVSECVCVCAKRKVKVYRLWYKPNYYKYASFIYKSNMQHDIDTAY